MVTSSTNLLERRNLGFWLSYPMKWVSISKDQKTKSANGPSFMKESWPQLRWWIPCLAESMATYNIYIYIYIYLSIYLSIYLCVYIYMWWWGEASTALTWRRYMCRPSQTTAPQAEHLCGKPQEASSLLGNNLDVQDRSSAQIKVEGREFCWKYPPESLTFGTWKWWFPNKNRLFQGKKIFRWSMVNFRGVNSGGSAIGWSSHPDFSAEQRIESISWATEGGVKLSDMHILSKCLCRYCLQSVCMILIF